jgi:hypothetical protein
VIATCFGKKKRKTLTFHTHKTCWCAIYYTLIFFLITALLAWWWRNLKATCSYPSKNSCVSATVASIFIIRYVWLARKIEYPDLCQISRHNMQWDLFPYAFFILFTPSPVTEKRYVTPANRADLHTATSLLIRVLKLHGLTVSENRERRHTV